MSPVRVVLAITKAAEAAASAHGSTPIRIRTVRRGLRRAAETVIPTRPAFAVAVQKFGKEPAQKPVFALPLALEPQLDPDLVANPAEVRQAQAAEEICAELRG